MLLDLCSDTKEKYGVPNVLKPIDERIAEVLALRFKNLVADKVPPVRNGCEAS